MKFSDIPNPAAANQAIRDFQKRFSTRVCLAPSRNDCTDVIISAHTLSASAMLRPISRQSRVYTHHADHYTPNEDGPISFKLRGINDTSVFYGFCSRHDAKLFSPIENNSFICSPEQIFLHSFRAVAKESYLKRKQAESSPSEDLIKKIHNLPDGSNLGLNDIFTIQKAASLQGAEEIERLKSKLDCYYLSSDWTRLATTVIPFTKLPNVVCNFVCAPDFDFSGNHLQDFEDFSKDLDHLMITVLPSGTSGFALLSHLDTAGSAPRKLIDSLLATTDVTTALVWLILGYAENIAISPDWFEGLSEKQRTILQKHFVTNIDWYDGRHNVLRECIPFIDDWGSCVPFRL
jgi:hypothetical protein